MAAPARNRRRAYRYGIAAETFVVWYLRAKGYRVLARGYRVSVGEIDIVATRSGSLAVIEVKARRDLAQAAEALNPHQRRRIERAAAHFIAAHPEWHERTVSFDLVLLAPWRPPKHLKNAWQID